ncbi:hypothetical protein HDV64DRAFT_189840 [Trichoderma sp. TUCIM 5745]
MASYIRPNVGPARVPVLKHARAPLSRMSLLQARAGCDETIEILKLYACRQAGASLRFAAALLCLIASVEVAVHDAASPGAEQPGVLGVLVQAGIRQFRGFRKADPGLLKRDHPSHTKQSPPSMTRRGRRGPLTNTVYRALSPGLQGKPTWTLHAR